jgi:hypothetical protein
MESVSEEKGGAVAAIIVGLRLAQASKKLGALYAVFLDNKKV